MFFVCIVFLFFLVGEGGVRAKAYLFRGIGEDRGHLCEYLITCPWDFPHISPMTGRMTDLIIVGVLEY